MFLLRSAFWLVLAFLVMGPRVDLGATAGDLSAQAVAAGQQMLVSSVLEAPCSSLECAGGRAMLAAATSFPSIDTAMQDSSARQAPVPRPRPDWMG